MGEAVARPKRAAGAAAGSKWAEEAKKKLLAQELGEGWTGVVESWWKLEEAYGFVIGTKSHSTTNRPDAVHNWVKNARKGRPAVPGGVKELGKQWGMWWKGINPEWRLRDGELVQDATGDWGILRCPGQNGFLNVVICLKWWYEMMEGAADDIEWKGAVADVQYVLEQMIIR
ncbi:hypothetical protein B0H16DRAFT_1324447 [Mycena metata]|uniref:Uncharacterized protein n=1 Tax=Mycena metata TaxID=1033252 RepID=A0AAD7MZV9_9AGAR|nr:hypothetical protein B0H16DRAFT_1324447 [Mycena metata]